MSNEHTILPQPTWHTPSSEPMKSLSHSHLFSLEQMLSDRQYGRPSPGVDLTLTRNGNSQNGELPTPISLSVRDTNKINSLPPSALDIQAVELPKTLSPSSKSLSPGLKSISPGLKSASPGLKSASPGLKSSSPGLKASSPSLKPASPGVKPLSPGFKPSSPGLKTTNIGLKSLSPGLKSSSPSFPLTSAFAEKQNSPKSVKRSNKRVDSLLERLNPTLDKPSDVLDGTSFVSYDKTDATKTTEKINIEKLPQQMQSVIVQASGSSHDENSNSSSILNVPTPTNIREEEAISPYSNEDSLDSNKSRRKRKPSKTIRVSKEGDKVQEEIDLQTNDIEEESHLANNKSKTSESSLHKQTKDETLDLLTEQTNLEIKIATEDSCNEEKIPETSSSSPKKVRRKTSSESETIDNIAAMVNDNSTHKKENDKSPFTNVSVINNTSDNDNSNPHNTTLITLAQRKATNFVEVENKLEEMFAGIEETDIDPLSTSDKSSDDAKPDFISDPQNNDSDMKLDYTTPSTSQSQDNVTSTSNETLTPIKNLKNSRKKPKRKSQKSLDSSFEVSTPKKKKDNKKLKTNKNKTTPKKSKKLLNGKQIATKVDVVKDIYAYDSGSNTSSTKSRGPFVQIKGPRDSPIAVNIINTPINEDEIDKKTTKPKKFHDDSEYRFKVKSKGLHSSTLSNKYDAQTRDITWICAFCKRGPHATDPNTTGPSTFNAAVPPPGDLFGPYIVSTRTSEFERRIDDPYDKQFISKKQCRTIEALSNANKSTGKKSKRKHSDSDHRPDETDVYLGITETSDCTFEIWVHENCVVWSPGIYLIGHKIVGLEEAVWTSCNINCVKCNFKGANICCLRRGCINVMHYGCAKASDWQLDNENYKALCNLHKNV